VPYSQTTAEDVQPQDILITFSLLKRPTIIGFSENTRFLLPS
jgi:hypothetical protein